MFKISEFTDALMITIADPIYPENDPELRKCYQMVLKKDTSKVFLELSSVGIIYSNGITELVQLFTQLRTSNRTLVMIGVQEGIVRIFKLLGLHQLFTITKNLEEAQSIGG